MFLSVSIAFTQEKSGVSFHLTKNSSADIDSSFDVLCYNIFLDINPQNEYIIGETELIFRLNEEKSLVYLNLLGLQVDSVKLDDSAVSFIRDKKGLSIPINSPHDSLRVQVYYQGRPANDGTGGFFFTDRWVYTMGEALNSNPSSSFRYWVPSHDQPHDKAAVDLYITVPTGLQVVSNGLLLEKTPVNEKTLFHWQEHHPIATYLIAVSVGDFAHEQQSYESIDGNIIPFEYYYYPEHAGFVQKDWQNTGTMMRFFEETFSSYPFDKYGMVELPVSGAMEHQTMTSYGQNLLTGNNKFDYIVAHELAHQWWGDLVTLKDWREIWLNEGFASYSEALYFEHIGGPEDLKVYMQGLKDLYLKEVRNIGHFPIYDPEYMWGGTVYQKGAWILHMLRRQIGDSSFFNLLRTYAQNFAYKNAAISDFVSLTEKASGQNLDWFFEQWIYDKGFPEIDIDWDLQQLSENRYEIQIELSQTQTTQDFFVFPLEIGIQMKNFIVLDTLYVEMKNQLFAFETNQEPQNILFDPDGWLLTNIRIKSRPLPVGFLENTIALSQNYPNPFIPEEYQSCSIMFQIPEKYSPQNVTLVVYNLLGQEIKRLIDKKMTAGVYTWQWDGTDNSGLKVATGTYFYTLDTNYQTIKKQMSVIRH